MSEGKRPGGLTALAVLNFVFGGFGALGLLGLLWFLNAPEQMAEAGWTRDGILLYLPFAVLGVGLEIAAGIGYLGTKRVLGRYVGNAFALAELAGTAVLITTHEFQLMSMVGLVYPVLTLGLLNTVFKDDLVN